MTRIQKFLQRIGMSPDTEVACTYDFIKEVQYHSVISIAYENLDILDKIPLKLDADSLYKKIVEKGRGGYCFEVNGLLAWFFKECGFEVREYFARFLRGEKEIPMRRHRVLSVNLDGGLYFCDIGIGQTAPRYPLLMKEGEVQQQFGETYKFENDDDLGWVLYDLYKGEWRQFISFTEEKIYDIDFVQPSVYCELHPDSVFNKVPMIAIKTSDGRKTIDDRTYKVFVGSEIKSLEENLDKKRFLELINTEFNIKYDNHFILWDVWCHDVYDRITGELCKDKSLAALVYFIDGGRELDIVYNGKEGFISMHKADKYVSLWYDKTEQSFDSVNALINNAVLDGKKFIEVWKDIELDCLY